MKVIKRDKINDNIVQYMISDVKIAEDEIYNVEIRVELQEKKVKLIHSLNIENDCIITPEDVDEGFMLKLKRVIEEDIKDNPVL